MPDRAIRSGGTVNEKPPPCHGPNARWWDVDATIEEHAKALPICHRCPIKYRCCDETRERFARGVHTPQALRGVPGLHAGLMWGDRDGPKSIWAWHATHGPTGEPRQATEVECEGPGCTERFISRSRNGYKRFHNRKCCDNARRIAGQPERARRAS